VNGSSRIEPTCRVRKKNGRATSGDRGGEPTVQVARPCLGTDRCLSRGRRLSAYFYVSKVCASKNPRRMLETEVELFSLSAMAQVRKSRIRCLFSQIQAFCNLRSRCSMRLLDARISRMHRVGCCNLTALDSVRLMRRYRYDDRRIAHASLCLMSPLSSKIDGLRQHWLRGHRACVTS